MRPQAGTKSTNWQRYAPSHPCLALIDSANVIYVTRAVETSRTPFAVSPMFSAAQERQLIVHELDRVQGASPSVAFERTPE